MPTPQGLSHLDGGGSMKQPEGCDPQGESPLLPLSLGQTLFDWEEV